MSLPDTQEGSVSVAAPPAPPGANGAASPATDLFDALGVAGVHMVEQSITLAQGLAACREPGEALAVSLRWSAGCMDQALADQARLMAAMLAMLAPADQAGDPAAPVAER